jgi:hypothetical protein
MTLNPSIGSPRVDDVSGIIKNVSVITEGPSLNGWTADAQTLRTLAALGNAAPSGVQTKLNHTDDAENIVGTVRNFRVLGNQLVGDLHLITAHESFGAIIETAETAPAAFGLSITTDPTLVAGVLRPKAFYSCDLVTAPAANPGGLLAGAGNRPNAKQLTALAKVLRVSPSKDAAALVEACSEAAYKAHVTFPGRASDATLAKQYNRGPRFGGMKQVQRTTLQNFVNKCFAE